MKKDLLTLSIIVVAVVAVLGTVVFSSSVSKTAMTTSINTFYSVELSSIRDVEAKGDAYDNDSFVDDNQLVISPHLDSADDSITYIVNVKNKSNIDTILKNIYISYEKDDLIFTFDNIEVGELFRRSESKLFYVTVKYNGDGEVIDTEDIAISFKYE